MTDNRGVSEVLGFVLMFAMIVASIGVLYGVGFGTLDDMQFHEQTNSGERALEAVAVGLEDIERDRGPNRAMDVNLGGRELAVTDGPRIEVGVDGEGVVFNDTVGALEYGPDEETTIAYSSGGVFRMQDDVGLLVREPRFRCGEDRAIVSLITLEGPAEPAFSGGAVRIVAEQQNVDISRLHNDPAENGDVTVSVDGETAMTDGWDRFFEDTHEDWDDEPPNCNAETVIVRETAVELDFVD